MHLGFRGKVFLATFGVSAAALLLAATLTSLWLRSQTYARVEKSLISEARLVADLLQRHPDSVSAETLDAEADRIGAALPARVTFIAPNGSVVGDSMVGTPGLASLENHGARTEVVDARRSGTGTARRFSHTLGTDMLYVAVRSSHRQAATVRLALPLTDLAVQTSAVRRVTLLALVVALAGAGALAWFFSSRFARRLNDLATSARRYAAGDLSQPAYHYEDDQVGTVARALDGIVRELVGRVRELAADRARIEAILSGMVEGVVVVSDDGRVQSVNRAALAMLGLADAAVGSHYLEAVRNPAVAALVTGALNGEQPAGLEISPGESSASRLVARAAPVPGAGNGAVLVLHDITDLRRADQVRRDFVTNVSHELRTPLTAIRGYAEALADDPQSPEERARFIDVIARHAGRMERLVRDLLRLASLDARQEVVEAGPVRLDELLEGVAADLEPMLDARRQRVELRVDPRVATITTDASKLQAALRNLVENAVNYSPEGRLIELDASAQGGVVALRVSDQGPGVPEADLERIFERFYRVDKARSRESGGTGLGLSIVKHLVELLGGRVWASNRPEGGATFTITLPLDAAGG